MVAEARRRLRTGLSRNDAIGGEIQRIEALLQTPARQASLPPPTHHPVLQHLPATLARVSGFENLAQHGAVLPWRYGYAPHNSRAGLETRLAWVEILGPDAPLRHASLGLGFVLFAPHTHYPLHVHPAVELYHVISGPAEWTAGDVTTERADGDFVLHPSGVAHATRTHHLPLLTLYTWTGDVQSPSRFVDD